VFHKSFLGRPYDSSHALVDIDFKRPQNKGHARSFILVAIDFSYTTSYRLSIVTFALGRTRIHSVQTTDDGRNVTDERSNSWPKYA